MAAPTAGEELSFFRIKELEVNPLPGNFDAAHLRAIHGYIFQDSPQYAPGQYRPENPGGIYVKNRALEATPARYHVHYRPDGIAAGVDEALKRFGGPQALHGLNADEAADKIATLYGNLDYAHPFREGNSRTLRHFTEQLVKEAGFDLDWSRNNADAASRDHLYIARDLAVTERAFPGLNRQRAMDTVNRAEYEAWALFAGRYQEHPRLNDVLRSVVQTRGTPDPSITGPEFAVSEARRLLGPGATVETVTPGQAYYGRIIGETPTHWIQGLTPHQAAIHAKANVSGAQLGSYGCIQRAGAGPAAFREIQTGFDGRIPLLSRNGKLLTQQETAGLHKALLARANELGR